MQPKHAGILGFLLGCTVTCMATYGAYLYVMDEVRVHATSSDWTPDYERLLLEASAQLEAATTDEDRWLALTDAALWNVDAGMLELAEEQAWEAWELSERFPETPVRYDQAHSVLIVIGRIALRKGEIDQAVLNLLRAGQVAGGPATSSFGPNMLLAKELLDVGESVAVLEYLELCGQFWDMGQKRLALWSKQISDGEAPDFGTNLIY